ncbi:unnamed protein product, partial [Vitis vinifera]
MPRGLSEELALRRHLVHVLRLIHVSLSCLATCLILECFIFLRGTLLNKGILLWKTIWCIEHYDLLCVPLAMNDL